jgi:tRNA 2-thiouridine synthesizing protein A
MSDIKIVDARGLSCPEPVLLTQNAIKKQEKGVVEVMVDNSTSRENVTRTAKNAGWSVELQEQDKGITRLILTK